MALVKFDVTTPVEMASVLTTESVGAMDLKVGDNVEPIIKAIHGWIHSLAFTMPLISSRRQPFSHRAKSPSIESAEAVSNVYLTLLHSLA